MSCLRAHAQPCCRVAREKSVRRNLIFWAQYTANIGKKASYSIALMLSSRAMTLSTGYFAPGLDEHLMHSKGPRLGKLVHGLTLPARKNILG